MRPSERDSAILEALNDHGFLRTEDVAERLGVSRMTTIRDFSRLQAHGLARRTFGGLVLPAVGVDEPSRARSDALPAELGRRRDRVHALSRRPRVHRRPRDRR
jgi:DeoR/GlpR family transcriptional regulator of sugar metabolism